MKRIERSGNYNFSRSNHKFTHYIGKLVAAPLILIPLAACDTTQQCVPGTANFTQQAQHEYILYGDELAALSSDYRKHVPSKSLDSVSGQALQADLDMPRSKNVRVHLYTPLGESAPSKTLLSEADDAANQLAGQTDLTGNNLIVVLPTEIDPIKQATTAVTIKVTSGTC